MIIDGREIANSILNELKQRVEKLKQKHIVLHLYIILLSNDPSSENYVKQKTLKGEQIGVKITIDKENPQIKTDELIDKIKKLNAEEKVHGIIVQRPMPKQLDEKKITLAVNPEKDIDGFHPQSEFDTPVALAVLEILQNIHKNNFQTWIKSQKITVIGKGITAGKPIIGLLEKLDLKPNIITKTTKNRDELLKRADIIISAVGKANLIDSRSIKKGAILIGVGMHRKENNKFRGDYDEEKIKGIASFYTPTPGGVGPVNVAMLLKNLIEAAEK